MLGPIIRLFSKRTNAIGQIATELGITDSIKLDQLGARTCAKKQQGLTMTELKQAWRTQIYELGMMDRGEGEQFIRYAPYQEPSHLSPHDCVDHAISLRFERASVMEYRCILETAYRHSLSYVSLTVDQITDTFECNSRILKIKDGANTFCTTRAVLGEEQQMVTLAQEGQGALRPLYPVPPTIALDGEQRKAVT